MKKIKKFSLAIVCTLVLVMVTTVSIILIQRNAERGNDTVSTTHNYFEYWLYPTEDALPYDWIPYVMRMARPNDATLDNPVLVWDLASQADEDNIPSITPGPAVAISPRIIHNHGTHTLNLTDGVLRTVGRSNHQYHGILINLAALGVTPSTNEYTINISGYLDPGAGTIGTGYNFRVLGENPNQQFADYLHNFGVYATNGEFDVTFTIPSSDVNHWSGNVLRIETNLAARDTEIVIESLTIYRISGSGSNPGPDPDFFQVLNLFPGGSVNEMRFSWHMPYTTGRIRVYQAGAITPVQIVDTGARRSYARTNHPWFPGLTTYYYIHQVAVEGLRADGDYEYVIEGQNGTDPITESERIPFRTGTDGDSFQFLVMGDPQLAVSTSNINRDSENWQRALTISTTMFPDAAFIISAGDQLHTNNRGETRWAGHGSLEGVVQRLFEMLLAPTELNSIPLVPLVGNHDAGIDNVNRDFWHDNHYTSYCPKDSPYLCAGNVRFHGMTRAGEHVNFDYYMRVGNTLFIMLDSNNYSMYTHIDGVTTRIEWLREVAERHSDATWKIAGFHFPMYSGFRSVYNMQWPRDHQRLHWTPILQELEIDVVLSAHDHTYSRSHQMYNRAPQLNQQWINDDGHVILSTNPTNAVFNPTGIVHFSFNQATGSNFRNVRHIEARDYLAAFNQNFRINFTVVDVTAYSLSITTHQINDDGSTYIVDVYTIVKGDQVPVGFIPPQMNDHILERVHSAPQIRIPIYLSEMDITINGLRLPTTVGVQTNLLSNIASPIAGWTNPSDFIYYYMHSTNFVGRGRPIPVPVIWDLSNVTIPPPGEQVGHIFTVPGVAQLPRGIVNPDGHSLNVIARVEIYYYIPLIPQMYWQMSTCPEVAAWSVGQSMLGNIHTTNNLFSTAGTPSIYATAGTIGPVSLYVTNRERSYFTIDLFTNNLSNGEFSITVVGRVPDTVNAVGLARTDYPWGIIVPTTPDGAGNFSITYRFMTPLDGQQRGFRIDVPQGHNFHLDDVIIEQWVPSR